MGNKVYSRVVLYKKDGSGWSSSGTVLTEARGVLVMKATGKIKDTFEFKLCNANNKYFSSTNMIEEDDKVRIYIWRNKAWSSLSISEQLTAFQIEGTIATFDQKFSVNGRDILIKGYGFADILFKGLVFLRSADLTKPHLMIQNIIAQVNGYNPYRQIYGADSSEWATIGNNTTKTDGSDFDDIQYSTSYKSALEIIHDLSSHQYTNDGNYVFKVIYDASVNRYNFHWYSKNVVSEKTIVVGVDDVRKNDLKKDKDKVINAVIYHYGFDCNSQPHEDRWFDTAIMTEGGAQWTYWTKTQTILATLILQEQENNSALFDADSDGSYKSSYPTTFDNGGGTWTFQFETRNDNGEPTGTKAKATNADDYNAAIVREGKYLGLEQAQMLTDRFSDAKWKGQIDIPQDNDIVEGILVDYTGASYGLTNKLIRCVEVHNDVWTTSLILEEDEKSVVSESA